MARELERITRLLVSTLIAPIIANSPLADHYESFIKTRIRFVFGGNDYAMSLRHWGNDGLMALFFFILARGKAPENRRTAPAHRLLPAARVTPAAHCLVRRQLC